MAGIATKLARHLHSLERKLALRPEPTPPDESERAAFGRLLTFTDLVFAVTLCILVFGLMRDVAAVYTDGPARGRVLMAVDAAAIPGQAADVAVRANGQDVTTIHVDQIYGGRLEVVARRESAGPITHFNLIQMMPALIKYVLAFSFLGLLWAMHRQTFQWIQRASSVVVLLNLVFLLGIVVNPFTTFFWSWNGLDDQDPSTWFWSDRQGTLVYTISLAGAAAALLATWVAAMLGRRNMHRGFEAIRWYYTLRLLVLTMLLLVLYQVASADVLVGNVGLVALLLGSVLLAGWVRHLANWLATLWGWLSIRLLLAVNPRAARYRQF